MKISLFFYQFAKNFQLGYDLRLDTVLLVVWYTRAHTWVHQIFLLFSLFLLRHPFIHLCVWALLSLNVLCTYSNNVMSHILLILLFCVWKLLAIFKGLCILFWIVLCIQFWRKSLEGVKIEQQKFYTNRKKNQQQPIVNIYNNKTFFTAVFKMSFLRFGVIYN